MVDNYYANIKMERLGWKCVEDGDFEVTYERDREQIILVNPDCDNFMVRHHAPEPFIICKSAHFADFDASLSFSEIKTLVEKMEEKGWNKSCTLSI